MIIVAQNLRAAFTSRLCEWQNAAVLFAWGFIVLLPFDAFSMPAFAGFVKIMDEEAWGAIALICGMIRLLALAVNGAWRPTYLLRGITAVGALFLWLLILIGFLSNGVLGTGLGVYSVLALFEVVNLFRVATDAAIAQVGAEANGRRRGDAANPA